MYFASYRFLLQRAFVEINDKVHVHKVRFVLERCLQNIIHFADLAYAKFDQILQNHLRIFWKWNIWILQTRPQRNNLFHMMYVTQKIITKNKEKYRQMKEQNMKIPSVSETRWIIEVWFILHNNISSFISCRTE